MKDLTILIPLIFLATLGLSQTTNSKTILINGVATEVVISETGEVDQIVKEKSDFMSDYTNDSSDIASNQKTNFFKIPVNDPEVKNSKFSTIGKSIQLAIPTKTHTTEQKNLQENGL